MKNIRRLVSLFAVIGAALFLMGAHSTVSVSTGMTASGHAPSSGATRTANSPHSSTTASVATGETASMVTRPTASAPTRPTAAPVTLSPYAEELARNLNFDRRVLIMLKEEFPERIQRMVGYDEDGYQIMAPGVTLSVPEDRSDAILASLRHKLAPLHYLAFIVEINAGLKMDKIGVLKGTDPYEILRIMHTDGDEYDISNSDVIERLKEWEKISSFEIIGADYDWVEIEFRRLPADLKAFAEEVYDFSPDAVDEGPGSVDGLVREIRKTNRLFLLWD